MSNRSDIDAKLAAMTPREEREASDYWKGALDAVCFFVLSAVVVTICLSLGNV